MRYRSLKIGFDNRKAHKQIVKELKKYSQCTQDAGAEIVRIKEIMKELPFDIELILITKVKKGNVTFQ